MLKCRDSGKLAGRLFIPIFMLWLLKLSISENRLHLQTHLSDRFTCSIYTFCKSKLTPPEDQPLANRTLGIWCCVPVRHVTYLTEMKLIKLGLICLL